MAVMDGVRIGPLDVDKGESFGQIGGQTAARRLIRHHTAMNPPALTAALSRVRQDARSDALDREEAEENIRAWYEEHGEALPEDSKITGYAVRGDDEAPELQMVTFTFTTKGGRTAKGFMPYRDLSQSVKAGDIAVARAKAIDSGHPVEAPAGAGDSAELRELRGLVEALTARLADVEDREPLDPAELARELRAAMAEDAAPDVGATGLPDGDAAPAPPVEHVPETDELVEPWEGFEGMQAQLVRQRLAESKDPDVAKRVLAWETRPDGGPNRRVVIAAANAILDRQTPTDET